MPPPIVAKQDVEMAFDLGQRIVINADVPFTITVRSKVDLHDAVVSFTVLGPKVTRYSPPYPLGNLKANLRTQVTDSLVFPEEAEYFIAVHVHTKAGFDKSDSRTVLVTGYGIVVNPTSVYGPPRNACSRSASYTKSHAFADGSHIPPRSYVHPF